MAVRTERSEVRTKTTEGQYSPVRLEKARLVSSLLYGTRVMLVSKLPAFENKKYTSYDHFHGNGPYGKIPTKKEPIRTPGFTPRLPCHIITSFILAGLEERIHNSVVDNTHNISPGHRGWSPATSWKTRLIFEHILKEAFVTTVSIIRHAGGRNMRMQFF